MKLKVKFEQTEQTFKVSFGEVNNVSDGGYERGYAEGEKVGYSNGYTEGETKGIEQGKQAEYDAFWDTFQQNGNRTDYQNGFYGACWNDTTFKPKHDIKPVGNNSQIFNGCGVTNLKAILERQGVTLDFSKVNYASNPFQSAQITHLPIMDVSGIDNLAYIFSYAKKLVSVDELIFRADGTQQLNANISFSYCGALAHCIFEGKIGAVDNTSFNMQWSDKLDVESAKSAIDCLINHSGTDKAYTCTFRLHNTVWVNLDADSPSPNGNSWKEYVADLGWLT